MKLQAVAVFMIVLVLSIPLYSASVMGDNIVGVSVSGSDDVEGYRKKIDVTHFEATIFGEEITAEKVYVESAEHSISEPFDSCVEDIVGYLCVKDFAEEEWTVSNYNFPVKLYNSQMELLSTLFGSISVDDVGPTIASFTADKNKVNDWDELKITYNVQDTAASGCSGISKVEFYAGANLVSERNIESSGCSYSESFYVNVSDFNAAEGQVELVLMAYDLLNQESEDATYTINLDNTGPTTVGVLELIKTDGDPLIYVPQNGINVKAIAYVGGDDFKSAKAQFIEFNPVYSTYEEFMLGDCVVEGDSHKCEWTVNVNVNEDTLANANFQLEDETGNVGETGLSYNLLVDNDAPVISNLETNFGQYVGLKNNFTLTLSETGSGFNDRKIYLNLAAIGLGIVQPNECNSTAGGWQCYWNDLIVPSKQDGNVTIIVMPSSTDDMGNYIEGPFEFDMVLDTTEPVLKTLDMFPIFGSLGYPANITEPKTGDSIYVVANLTDITSLTVQADLSEVIIAQDFFEGECDGVICEFTTSEVVEGPTTGTIDFTFIDQTGNRLEHSEDVIIYGVDNTSFIVERWLVSNDYNSETMPEYVDAEITSLVPFKVYFPIEINSKYSGYVEPAEIYDLNCDSSDVGEPYLFGNSNCPDCTDFYAVVPLNLQEYTEDLEIECSFKLVSIYGNVFSRRLGSPEEYNLTLKIEFEGNPLGSLGDAARKKVDAIKDSDLVSGGFLDALIKIEEFSSAICSVISTITEIATVVDLMVALFTQGIGGVLPMLKPGNAVVEGAVVGFTQTTLQFENINKYFCAYINCEGNFGMDWLGTWQGWVNSYQTGDFFLPEELEISASPRESLVLSAATFCLPGIIHNIEKARQIECKYVYCMEAWVPEGMPSFSCERDRAYSWCAYVYGEYFNLVPFSAFLEGMTKFVGEALKTPLSAAAGIVAGTCTTLSILGAGEGAFCSYTQMFGRVTSHIDAVIGFVEGDVANQFGLGSQGDFCRKLEKDGYMDD